MQESIFSISREFWEVLAFCGVLNKSLKIIGSNRGRLVTIKIPALIGTPSPLAQPE